MRTGEGITPGPLVWQLYELEESGPLQQLQSGPRKLKLNPSLPFTLLQVSAFLWFTRPTPDVIPSPMMDQA